MRRLLKRLGSVPWKRWIASLAALLALLAVSFLLLIQTDWFKQKLLDRVVAQIEAVTGGRVELAGYDFEPFELRATLTDLAVFGSEQPAVPPFLQVPSLRLQLGVTSFLRREFYLRSMQWESPRVRIEVAEDGSTNLPRLALDGQRSPAEELFDLAVDRVDLTRGSVEWNGARYPVSFSSEEFSLRTRYERNLNRYRAWLRLGETAIDISTRRPVLTESELEFFLYRDRIEAPELYIAGKGFQMFTRLDAAPLARPTVRLDYDVRLDLATLSSWTGAPATGQAEIHGEAQWAVGDATLAYQGRVEAKNLSLPSERFELPSVELAARFAGGEQRVALQGIRAGALGGIFTGEGELDQLSLKGAPRFQLRGDFDGFPLQAVLSAAESAHPSLRRLPWSSTLRGWLRLEGTGAADLNAAVSLIFAKPEPDEPGGIPLSGVADVAYSALQRSVQVPRLDLATPGSQVRAHGTITPGGEAALQVRVDTQRPDDLLAVLGGSGTGPEPAAPLLVRGSAHFEGSLTGDLMASPPQVELKGRLEANDFVMRGYEWKRFHGNIDYQPSRLAVSDAQLEGESALAHMAGAVELRKGKPFPESELEGDLRFENLPVAKMLQAAGRTEPITGKAQGRIRVAGTVSHPQGTGEIEIAEGSAWQQPFDRLQVALRLEDDRQIIESFELAYRQARLQLQAELQDRDQSIRFDVRGSQWRLQDLEAIDGKQEVAGEIQLDLKGTGRFSPDKQGFAELAASGTIRVADLRIGERELGAFSGKVSTQPDAIRVDWEGGFATGELRGTTKIRPGDENTVAGDFRWNKLNVADLAALADVPLEKVSGETDGSFTFSGRLPGLDGWRAAGEITRLEVSYSEIPGSTRGYSLWNPFPMRWSVADQTLRLENMRLLGGEGTDILVNGSVGLQEPRALDLSTSGTFNLAVVEGFLSEIQARGSSTLEINLRGSLQEPRMRGRMEVENASLRHRDFSNGLSQMTAVLRFDDRRVTIERLQAASGGGTLRLAGMAEHDEGQWSYRLDTDVDRVRLRYPEPVSSVIAGSLTLSGTDLQSWLSGDILVSQVTVSSRLELGTIIAGLAEPRQTLPSNPALGNMQLNVRIDSVPDLRLETTLVRNAAADFDLRLAGTALNPALLGDVHVTQGQLEFQGTRFEINRGHVSFVNPFRIDPVIDFELETRVRDIDIALTLSGPARKINVTPRSDPPLPFSDLIQLLALGRTPTTDPVLAARETVAQQSLTQTGANTILSQALSQPVNRRMQRFFGVSRLKVDPQVGGAEANPGARISTEQQITSELTFTYSYDLSSAQQQVVRIDWTPTRQWSFIVTRDENGLVGADVLFKKRMR